ncbi:ABC transporter B family member 4 [Halotydeus destructor]|nr:ABC transporter B family member 4 [Halotydeus destructor]
MLINVLRLSLRSPVSTEIRRNLSGIRATVNRCRHAVTRHLPRSAGLRKCSKLSLSLIGSGIYIVKAQDVNNNESLKETSSSKDGVKSEQEEKFSWTRLWSLLSPDKGFLLIAVASAFIVAIFNIHIPLSLGELTNVLSRYVSNDQPWTWAEFAQSIREPSVKLMSMYLFQSLFTFINISSLTIAGEKMATRLRGSLFDSIMSQDIAFFDATQTGEVVNRLTTDVQDFKSAFKMCLSQGLRSITQSIGCAAALYVISPKMTVVMASVISSLILIGSCLGAFLRILSRRAQEQIAKSTAMATEAIGAVRTVRAFAMEDEISASFSKELKLSEKMHIQLGLGIGAFQSLTNLALNGIVLGTLMFGGYLLSTNELSAGNLMSFLVATQTIQRSLAQLSLLYGHYMKMVTSGSRVFHYLDINPTIRLHGGAILGDFTGRVCFNVVSFRYPGRPEQTVLRDFYLTLEPGQVTAVCGLSGAGKSTLGVLLERFYDVESGSIEIDDVDIRELDPSWVRGRLIGYINQEPILFATSIMENIRFGRPQASDDEVYRAAELANADSFIRSFPHGYDTVVGERGVSVSGGQKQRIAIARAILKDPPILILDEATSALDSQSEQLVHEALERVMKGKTVLIIAHRLSTIKDADVIAVMSKGKLQEVGTHKALIAKKGAYFDLVKGQRDGSE